MYKIPDNTIIKHLSRDYIDNTADIGGSFLVKKHYLNYVRNFIDENNDRKIISLQVFRQPIGKAMEIAMRLISLGKFRKEKYGYDAFFHLGLVAVLDDNRKVLIEKNATIDIKQISKNPNGEYMDVYMSHAIPLIDFLNNGQKQMSDDYFTYNPLSNNCQNYVLGLLQGNGLLDNNLKQFIYQDISDYKNKVVNFIGDKATNIAAIGNRIVHGGSFGSHLKNHHVNVNFLH